MRPSCCLELAGLIALLAFSSAAQTTQAVVAGRVIDSVTGKAVLATLTCTNEATSIVSTVDAALNGYYAFLSLSPGRYTLSISASKYQNQQFRNLELPVAARVEISVRIRPLTDVWEAGQYRSWLLPESQQSVGFYGPDVDTSRVAVFNANRGYATPFDNARSDVLSSPLIENLPLLARDAYTLLLLLPGVTSDTATGRGLGYSVNGQRPTASNFLLDGAENNNLLVTGPLSAARPEFVQEYRISTANYSAEYGRTSGFIANAETPSGTNKIHGELATYFGSDRLNANGFQENARGYSRSAAHVWLPAAIVSGPVLRNRVFYTSAWAGERTRGEGDPVPYALPTLTYLNGAPLGSYGRMLLTEHPPSQFAGGATNVGTVTLRPPANLNRDDALTRLDFTPRQGVRVIARGDLDQLQRPELLFSPYRQYSTDFRQAAVSLTFGVTTTIGHRALNEFRLSRLGDALRLTDRTGGLPQLVDLEQPPSRVLLPGGTADFNYRSRGSVWEIVENFSFTISKHTFKMGGGYLERNTRLSLVSYPFGRLEFATLTALTQGVPQYLFSEIDRYSNSFAPVNPQRGYRYRQPYTFAQDSFPRGPPPHYQYRHPL